MILNTSEKAKIECLRLVERLKKTSMYECFSYLISTKLLPPDLNLFIPPNFLTLEKVKTKLEEKHIYYTVEEFIHDAKTPFQIVS